MTTSANPELARRLGVLAVSAASLLLATACAAPGDAPRVEPAAAADEPCLMPTTQPAGAKLERFAVHSPFDREYKPPAEIGGKRIWADSRLWEDAPRLQVEKWLTAEPNTTGKFVLVEFWATWCPPCRRSISLLNKLHRRFGRDLVVIGVSDESEADVRAIKEKYGIEIEYFSAIDTRARTKDELGVYGIPHVIVVEPGGVVIWEGFPLLAGHELTEALVEKMIDIGRKSGSLK